MSPHREMWAWEGEKGDLEVTCTDVLPQARLPATLTHAAWEVISHLSHLLVRVLQRNRINTMCGIMSVQRERNTL